MPKEEGDAVREYNAMHEENFLSSWLREDVERVAKASEKNEEESGEKRKREEEKEENQTVTVKRRCEGLFLWKPYNFLSQTGDVESDEDLSGEDPLMSLRAGLVVSLIRVRVCVWCLM